MYYRKIVVDYYNEFKSLVKDKNELNIIDLCNQLKSFVLSDNFIPCIFLEKTIIKNENLFIPFVVIYESKEKYLSLKVFLNLLEELKKMKFDTQIKEIYKEIKAKNNFKSFENQILLYFGKNTEILNTKNNELDDNLKKIQKFNEENKNFIEKLWKIDLVIFNFTFKFIFDDNDKKSIKLDHSLFEFIYTDDLQEVKNIINNLIKINLLNYTINSKHIVMFILNLNIICKEITLREPKLDAFFDNFNKSIDINDQISWILYEKSLNSLNEKQKYIKTLLEGKMTEKEKYKFDLFDNIYKINTQYIKGMNGSIFKSLFDANEIVLIIQFDLDYLKNNKPTSEKIHEQIDSIKKCIPPQYEIISLYAQLENRIINLDVQYELFLSEMKKKISLKKVNKSQIRIKIKSKY